MKYRCPDCYVNPREDSPFRCRKAVALSEHYGNPGSVFYRPPQHMIYMTRVFDIATW